MALSLVKLKLAMMAWLGPICRSILIIVALNFLITITLGSCQQSESIDGIRLKFFVAVSNSDSNDGVMITVFPDEIYSGLIDNRTYFIPDRRLPPECGAQYFRCRDLLVESLLLDGREMNVLFIPLESSMAIVQLYITNNNIIREWHTLIVDSPDCSPTVIYKAGESLFTVCINFTLQHIAVYEIQLHWNEKQIIDGAVFEGPRTQLSFINFSSFYISNFVLNVSSQVHKVYFAVDNAIFVMDIHDATQTRRYPDLPQCRHIHKLTLADKHSLLVCCSDRYIGFDPVYGDWTQIHTYSKYGIPYLCPNNNYKVTFFNNTEGDFLQFTKEGSMLNPIYNIDISSGICFEIANTTYFTWSDPQHNSVFVFDFVSGNHFPISPYECSSMDCPQLLLLNNQYIVVRSDDSVFVIDAKSDFNLIVNVSLANSDILTALFFNAYKADTTTHPTTVRLSPSTNISTTMVSPFKTTYTTTTTSTPIKNVVATVMVSPFKSISITYTIRPTSFSTLTESLSSRIASLFNNNSITYATRSTTTSTLTNVVSLKTSSPFNNNLTIHATTTVSLFTNVLPSRGTVSLYSNDSTTTSAPVVHNNVSIAIIPTTIIVITLLVVVSILLLIYKIAKRRWYVP